MIRIELVKVERPSIRCANPNCKKLPQHVINILGSVYHIKVDTTAAQVELKGEVEYHCRGCIDELYNMLKTKLDPRLWAFH